MESPKKKRSSSSAGGELSLEGTLPKPNKTGGHSSPGKRYRSSTPQNSGNRTPSIPNSTSRRAKIGRKNLVPSASREKQKQAMGQVADQVANVRAQRLGRRLQDLATEDDPNIKDLFQGVSD